MTFQTATKSAIYGLYDLDVIDQKIIAILQKDGRESFAKMSDEIGIPASTIRDRTNHMVTRGVIKVVAVLNPKLKEHHIEATVGISVAEGDARSLAEKLAAMDEVIRLVICAGSFDLMLELSCKDNDHLLDVLSRLQNMPHVRRAETFIHFSMPKGALAVEF